MGFDVSYDDRLEQRIVELLRIAYPDPYVRPTIDLSSVTQALNEYAYYMQEQRRLQEFEETRKEKEAKELEVSKQKTEWDVL